MFLLVLISVFLLLSAMQLSFFSDLVAQTLIKDRAVFDSDRSSEPELLAFPSFSSGSMALTVRVPL